MASHLFNCCCVFACVWVSEWIAPREKKHTSQFLFESVCALCDYWFALCILYLLGVLGEVMVSPLGARECAFFSHRILQRANQHTRGAQNLSLRFFLCYERNPRIFSLFILVCGVRELLFVPHSFSSLCVSDVTRLLPSLIHRLPGARRWSKVAPGARCFWRTPSDGSCGKSVLTAWCSRQNTGGQWDDSSALELNDFKEANYLDANLHDLIMLIKNATWEQTLQNLVIKKLSKVI